MSEIWHVAFHDTLMPCPFIDFGKKIANTVSLTRRLSSKSRVITGFLIFDFVSRRGCRATVISREKRSIITFSIYYMRKKERKSETYLEILSMRFNKFVEPLSKRV